MDEHRTTVVRHRFQVGETIAGLGGQGPGGAVV